MENITKIIAKDSAGATHEIDVALGYLTLDDNKNIIQQSPKSYFIVPNDTFTVNTQSGGCNLLAAAYSAKSNATVHGYKLENDQYLTDGSSATVKDILNGANYIKPISSKYSTTDILNCMSWYKEWFLEGIVRFEEDRRLIGQGSTYITLDKSDDEMSQLFIDSDNSDYTFDQVLNALIDENKSEMKAFFKKPVGSTLVIEKVVNNEDDTRTAGTLTIVKAAPKISLDDMISVIDYIKSNNGGSQKDNTTTEEQELTTLINKVHERLINGQDKDYKINGDAQLYVYHAFDDGDGNRLDWEHLQPPYSLIESDNDDYYLQLDVKNCTVVDLSKLKLDNCEMEFTNTQNLKAVITSNVTVTAAALQNVGLKVDVQNTDFSDGTYYVIYIKN